MYPVLFRIPFLNYELPGYGLALMLGLLVSIMWAAHRALKSGGNPDVILNCGFIALICGVVGARVMYVVHYWDQYAYRSSTLEVVRAVLDVRKGGLEVYGGFLLSVAVVVIYLWRWKHSLRWYFDIIAPSAALGMAIGRIGCFLNGCCWGGVCTEIPWAVRFPCGSPAAVQQWTDRVPGAGLPDELLMTSSEGFYLNGQAAAPLPRDVLRFSDDELNTAANALRSMAARQNAILAKLSEATAAEERRGLQTQLQALQEEQRKVVSGPGGCISGEPLYYGAEQMVRFDLKAAELRALAKQHRSLPVHPTQLYSVAILGVLALMLNALYWRRTRDGQVICTLLMVEPPMRWALETIRADNPVDTAGLTISQFLAIGISLAGLVCLIWLQRLPPRSPRAALWVPPDDEQPSTPSKPGGSVPKRAAAR